MATTMKLAARIFMLVSLALCVHAAQDLQEATVIKVPPGYRLAITLSGKGYQYYRFNGTDWVNFKAKARLYNSDKKQIGRHFYLPHPDALGGQPTWETIPSKGVPYSIVTGKPVAKTTISKGSIPWVLLQATSSQYDKRYFGAVRYVQRLNTMGGIAPSIKLSAPKGRVRRTPYTADYAFHVKQ
jgi:hypothetical protein